MIVILVLDLINLIVILVLDLINLLYCYFSIRPNKLDCYFSIRPNKAFPVPDWGRANDKKKQQYKCSCYTGHPQKPLERQLFLLFSIKFGSCSWFFRHCRINTIYVHSVLNKTLLALAPKQAKMLAKQALFKACF